MTLTRTKAFRRLAILHNDRLKGNLGMCVHKNTTDFFHK